jgi:hypothetical protein
MSALPVSKMTGTVWAGFPTDMAPGYCREDEMSLLGEV